MTKTNNTKYLGLIIAIGIGVVMAWVTRPRVNTPALLERTRSSEQRESVNESMVEPSVASATVMAEGEAEASGDQGPTPVSSLSLALHGSPAAAGDGVPIDKVDKAGGASGMTVAEIYGARRSLVGKRVRVRAVVVRSTAGIMGRVFSHLRDGSGSPQNGDHDLTVTTDVESSVGSTVLFAGTVVVDKDFGTGYRYPVVLENATVESN